MTDTPQRLSVAGLRVESRSSTADIVSEVGFDVGEGRILGLVGESGSGKTTVALALLGYARAGLVITAGSVKVDGVDVLKQSPRDLQHLRGRTVSYVPQDPSSALNPVRRVGAQLREGLEAHAKSDPTIPNTDERIAEILEEVGLSEVPDVLLAYPHQLSGGQRQRVAIGMAFACRPKLIVLDEPTTGLDVTTQRLVLETVRGLCRAYGVSAVYVSHDLAVVGELVNDVAVMYGGRVIELGPADAVLSSPAHPYTRRLLRAVPSPDHAHALQGMEGHPPLPGRRPVGCGFAPRCDFAIGQCVAEEPPVSTVAGGGGAAHTVRCIRSDELKRGAFGVPWVFTEHAPRTRAVDDVLRVSGVSAGYGETPVLEHVDVSVGAGRCLAIVGESGSGKTTLARCIVGLHTNWSGTIEFQQNQLTPGLGDRDMETLRRIQYVFQDPYMSLNPRRTVGDILAQVLSQFFHVSGTERAQRVSAAIEDTALSSDTLNRYPGELSGGQRQRVAIARTLITEPDLLVCDEPTSALDVSVQASVVELLRRLQEEKNLSLMFITHNLALVRSVADDVVVLRDGRVVEKGSVVEVLDSPTNPYTRRLLDDVPRLSRHEHDENGEPAAP